MPAIDRAWPARFDDPITRCAEGSLPANVALMQMAALAESASELEQVLDSAAALLGRRAGLTEARRLIRDTPGSFALIKSILTAVAAKPGTSPAAWSVIFDEAVTISPEGSVALYSLGVPRLLQHATDEIVGWFGERRLLGSDRIAIEIGCGIGRFLSALSGRVRLVLGIDVSRGMLREARTRTAGLPGCALVQGAGNDLRFIGDEAADLIFAADSFPYLVEAGPAVLDGHLADARRILRPGGSLVVLNWSYRGDPDRDRRDAEAAADRFGLALLRNGEGGLTYWDGRIFHFEKAVGS